MWDNSVGVWPPQPYQPELVVLYYEVAKKNEKVTTSIYSFGLSQAQRNVMDEAFYKCCNRNYLREGFYDDAQKDCENSNSSFRTYLTFNQVGLKGDGKTEIP